jgi:nitroreductase
VLEAAKRIKDFFIKLNRLAENVFLRKALKLIGKSELEVYYRDYYRSVKEAVRQHEEYGKDLLFHGATAAIVVGSGPDASCPAEDALLATQNIILGAHALGLGTCLIGFAAKAMQKDKSIPGALGIPDEESVYAVIALGYPNETYQKPCGRKKPLIRFAH